MNFQLGWLFIKGKKFIKIRACIFHQQMALHDYLFLSSPLINYWFFLMHHLVAIFCILILKWKSLNFIVNHQFYILREILPKIIENIRIVLHFQWSNTPTSFCNQMNIFIGQMIEFVQSMMVLSLATKSIINKSWIDQRWSKKVQIRPKNK